jgi:hypothetical protein
MTTGLAEGSAQYFQVQQKGIMFLLLSKVTRQRITPCGEIGNNPYTFSMPKASLSQNGYHIPYIHKL